MCRICCLCKQCLNSRHRTSIATNRNPKKSLSENMQISIQKSLLDKLCRELNQAAGPPNAAG